MPGALEDLLPAIRSGDSVAFGRWMAGAESRMRLSLRSFAAVVDVEAVLQESLLRTWQVASRVEPDGKPDALLRVGIRIARNLAISERRRARGVPTEDEDLERALALQERSATAPDPLLRKTIAGCAQELPAQPARALQLRLDSAGSQDDEALAELLGMRKNTFLQNFTRARKLLAECLERHGVDLAKEVT
jgi:DNA-directed RNA polymerase specialized sigma24 family protein